MARNLPAWQASIAIASLIAGCATPGDAPRPAHPVEGGVAVEAVCATRCMEISLQEFAVDAPKTTGLTPGQILIVGGASIPFVGGLIRTIAEQEREQERAPNRTKGVVVTCAARDGNRYTARAHVVAIISATDVALERQ